MTAVTKSDTDAAILRRIAFIAIDGLNPSQNRIDLVNKMRTIFTLADRECRESDAAEDDD